MIVPYKIIAICNLLVLLINIITLGVWVYGLYRRPRNPAFWLAVVSLIIFLAAGCANLSLYFLPQLLVKIIKATTFSEIYNSLVFLTPIGNIFSLFSIVLIVRSTTKCEVSSLLGHKGDNKSKTIP
jgi:hypothetical protein